MPPPLPLAVLLVTVEFVIVADDPSHQSPPPEDPDVFDAMAELSTSAMDPSVTVMPPPFEEE